MSRAPVSRRTVLAGMAGSVVASTAFFRRTASAQGGKKLSITVGRQPFGSSATAVTRYMIQTRLFEKEAAASGYDLTVDFRDFPNAAPIMELIKAGPDRMAIAVIGNTPIVIGIANELPIQVLTTAEGKMPFYLLVRPNSEIKTIDDLKGKVIGTIVGTDPHSAFIQTLHAEFGKTPDELGIRIQNFPEFPTLARLPRGIDAAALVPAIPAFNAMREGHAVALFDTLGMTGPAYKGGPGQRLPSVSRSLFRPEGFFQHRGMWVAHAEVMKNEPRLVHAWIRAQQKALTEIKKLGPEKVAEDNQVDWKQPIDIGAKFIREDLVWQRGWVWLTEGEILSVVTASRQMAKAGVIRRPVTWDLAKEHLKPTMQMQHEAWESAGRVPPASEFEKPDSELTELRGLPVWRAPEWKRFVDR
jgi:ABC-type nitrate/sulfonate/bicarbonate transport system substrate-binding protein